MVGIIFALSHEDGSTVSETLDLVQGEKDDDALSEKNFEDDITLGTANTIYPDLHFGCNDVVADDNTVNEKKSENERTFGTLEINHSGLLIGCNDIYAQGDRFEIDVVQDESEGVSTLNENVSENVNTSEYATALELEGLSLENCLAKLLAYGYDALKFTPINCDDIFAQREWFETLQLCCQPMHHTDICFGIDARDEIESPAESVLIKEVRQVTEYERPSADNVSTKTLTDWTNALRVIPIGCDEIFERSGLFETGTPAESGSKAVAECARPSSLIIIGRSDGIEWRKEKAANDKKEEKKRRKLAIVRSLVSKLSRKGGKKRYEV